MEFYPHQVYHIYNRGNQQQTIFFSRDNYLFFLRKMRKELLPHCHVLAYCLMPNHFHWLVQVKENCDQSSDDLKSSDNYSAMHPLSKATGILLRSYTRALQKQEGFTGSLFQQKTKTVNITGENHLLTCANYIHQNPMRAKLAEKMEDWEYSSFSDYCGLRNGTMCNQELLFNLTGVRPDSNFRQLSYGFIPDSDLKNIL